MLFNKMHKNGIDAMYERQRKDRHGSVFHSVPKIRWTYSSHFSYGHTAAEKLLFLFKLSKEETGTKTPNVIMLM